MDEMAEDDWCEIGRRDFVRDDCLSSTNFQQCYSHCCSKSGNACCGCDDLLQLNKTETATPHYGDIISDNSMISLDGTHVPLETLEEQLNFASSLFDVKIHLNNSYSNEVFHCPATAGQSFVEEDEGECGNELKGNAKTRQKMHEMAVKQKLITEQDPRGHGFLHLSSEEKRALLQEGYKLPTMLPLTKSEEDALKLSAQESRRKRKEYMDALEKRIQYYSAENSILKSKLRDLEQTNRILVIELRNFKTAIASNHSTEYHPSCPTPVAAAIN
ncbi:unnamed protein product [Litomosoides sigmodontis]|uniref:BZIP domain-containing protein n=1 Tax=Litomosoides sigmodontis TaxID=42156 RepID=A0A3P6T930_LITSI|nr:unnamed protein product [Litomosoides sigmodontis]